MIWNLVRYWPTIRPSRHWCHEAQDETSKMGLQLHNFEPVLWAVGYHVEQKMIEVKTYMLWSFVLTSSHVFTLEHSHWWNYYFSYLTLQIIVLFTLPFHFTKHPWFYFLPINLNIISLIIFYYFFPTSLYLSLSLLCEDFKEQQTQNPSHLHCHPQPTATSTTHKPPLPQPKSTKFATKSSKKPTKITHKNNQNLTNPQILQQ